MKDYDLSKILTKVKDIYEKTGIWPEYVELPRASYHAIFGYDGTQGSQSVMIPSVKAGESFISKLFYRPFDGDRATIRWSRELYNPHVVKDKKHPPKLRYVPVVERCGNCRSSTLHNQDYAEGQIRCHKYELNLHENNCCDDWSKDV
jgi:hypothetical protein